MLSVSNKKRYSRFIIDAKSEPNSQEKTYRSRMKWQNPITLSKEYLPYIDEQGTVCKEETYALRAQFDKQRGCGLHGAVPILIRIYRFRISLKYVCRCN